eukprot:snap_masked-scaffold_6-processed-gene-2.30-mRNA-1 protein AED:1.00 eAED:1.00 QI:0/-1/0/0/-1/1/1/0/517
MSELINTKNFSKSTVIQDIHFHVLLLGGGVCSGFAAKKLVELRSKSTAAFHGKFCGIVSAEIELPYYRNLLSGKVFDFSLNAKELEEITDDLEINSGKWYSDNDIEVLLGCQAVEFDPKNKRVKVFQKEDNSFFWVEYDRLLVATGSRPLFTDMFPKESIVGNVHALRNLEDAKNIVKSISEKLHKKHNSGTALIPKFLNKKLRIAVCGGGFLGIECAVALSQISNAEVSLVFAGDNLVRKLFTKKMSLWYKKFLAKTLGINIFSNTRVAKFIGNESNQLIKIKFSNGSSINADIALMAMGVVLNTEIFEEKLQLMYPKEDLVKKRDSGSICVDKYLRTSDPFVFSAGDCCSVPFGVGQRRIQHFDHAKQSAETAAQNIFTCLTLAHKQNLAPSFRKKQFQEYEYNNIAYYCYLSNDGEFKGNYFGFQFYGNTGRDLENVSEVHFGDFESSKNTAPKGVIYLNGLSRIIGIVLSCVKPKHTAIVLSKELVDNQYLLENPTQEKILSLLKIDSVFDML